MPIRSVTANLQCELCAERWSVQLDAATTLTEQHDLADLIDDAIMGGHDVGFVFDGSIYCADCDRAFSDSLDHHAPGWEEKPVRKQNAIEANVWPWFVEERKADLSTTDTPE